MTSNKVMGQNRSALCGLRSSQAGFAQQEPENGRVRPIGNDLDWSERGIVHRYMTRRGGRDRFREVMPGRFGVRRGDVLVEDWPELVQVLPR